MTYYFSNAEEVVCSICLLFEETVLRGVKHSANMMYYY